MVGEVNASDQGADGRPAGTRLASQCLTEVSYGRTSSRMEISSMRYLVALVAASGVVLQSGVVPAQDGQFPFVLTRQEQVLGVVEGGVASFKGIPYASAPLGSLRWRAPQPPPESSAIRSAHEYAPACEQPSMPGPGSYRTSEDCLTLNVFRPFEIEDPLPVMIWIHGGSFVAGNAGDPLFDGSKLAQAGVVVITLNYRLGAFGWLAHPALAEGASNSHSANYGMMDQIAALRWVHDNIRAFGGNFGRAAHALRAVARSVPESDSRIAVRSRASALDGNGGGRWQAVSRGCRVRP